MDHRIPLNILTKQPVTTVSSFLPRDNVLLQPPKFLRIKSVLERTKLSRSYIYQLSKEGVFPKSVNLVPGGTSVAWVESEVEEWIGSRIAARDEETI